MRYTLSLALLLFGQLEALVKYESEMVALQDSMRTVAEDSDRFKINESFQQLMTNVLNSSGAFEYPFDSVRTMSILTSPDETFRIFNWNVSRNDETHVYYCYVLTKDEKKGIYNWFELSDNEDDTRDLTSSYLAPDDWMGCLYYQIIPVGKRKSKKTYTLLGWDGNNRYTTKKVIDALSFEKKGPRLGAPIFKTKKGTKKRYVLEYSSEVMVTLKWKPKEKRIVFDHLSPRDGTMEGIYAFYGPDFTYDAFNLEKNKWVLEEKVEVTLERQNSNREYNDPRER